MKTIKWVFIVVMMSGYHSFSQSNVSSEIINNETIVQLTKIGMGKDVIVEKINSSKTDFDLTTEGLIKLKKDKVDDMVIASMLKMNKSVKTTSSQTDKEEKKLTSGIYYFKDASSLVQLDATPLTSGKSAGLFNRFTSNIAADFVRQKDRLIIDRETSNFQIKNSKPEFNFIFNSNNSDLNNSTEQDASYTKKIMSRWLGQAGSASSPNDFILIKMDVISKTRQILTEGHTAHDAGGGISKSQTMSFKFEKLDNGKYRVYFEDPLKEGEYCFYYANAKVNQENVKDLNVKVYDFAIVGMQ